MSVAEVGETPATILATIDAWLLANPGRATGRAAAYAFDLSGEMVADFPVILADGAGRAGQAAPEKPEVTLSMTAADFVAMTVGQLDATMAFIDGWIGIVGDISLRPT